MARVITFSRYFPTTHPLKGEHTFFVEQIWNGLNKLKLPLPKNKDVPSDFLWSILPLSNYGDKYHTIRRGYRWKVGDKFSPRVWSGKPYASKQIVIAPDIEIKKIWDFSRDLISDKYYLNGHEIDADKLELIAKNDGLTIEDFKAWLNKPFLGQILCWNESIDY